MTADVLVIVDFYDANQTQRNAFANQIGANNWKHHPRLANAYFASIDEVASDEVLVARSEDEMSQAAKLAGIEQWDATCIVGDPGWLSKTPCCS